MTDFWRWKWPTCFDCNGTGSAWGETCLTCYGTGRDPRACSECDCESVDENSEGRRLCAEHLAELSP